MSEKIPEQDICQIEYVVSDESFQNLKEHYQAMRRQDKASCCLRRLASLPCADWPFCIVLSKFVGKRNNFFSKSFRFTVPKCVLV